jgi:hypothetical protein
MTQDQTDGREPVPSFTPVSATRADTPKQTEFRLVSPAPPPETDSAATLPTTPEPVVPSQARRTAADDAARGSAGQLADGEELMPGADADEPPAHDDTDEELPPPGTTSHDEPPAHDDTDEELLPPGTTSHDEPPAHDDTDEELLPPRTTSHDEPPAYGDVDDEPLLSGLAELRAGWQRARIGFVDNPRGAVAAAAGLADEAAEALAAALRERRQRIRATWDGDEPTRDTEALRVALLRYQALFGKIVGE